MNSPAPFPVLPDVIIGAPIPARTSPFVPSPAVARILAQRKAYAASPAGLRALARIAWREYTRTLSDGAYARWKAAAAARDAAK
jgi:hypothetical protein